MSFEDVVLLEERRSVSALIGLLYSDVSPVVKMAAMEALGRLGDTSAIGLLIEALDSDEPRASEAASYALAKIGNPAVPALIQSLKSPNSSIRKGAVVALGKIGDKRAIVPLIQALDDESGPVKHFAGIALGNFPGDARVVEALIQSLEHGLHYVAAESLAKLECKEAVPHIILHLGSRRGGQHIGAAMGRARMIRVLAKLGGPEIVKPLVDILPGAGRDIQWEVGKALGALGPQILDQILALLKSKQWKRRLAGVSALKYMEELETIAEDRVLDTLLITMWDQNKLIKRESLNLLRRLKDPRLVQPLLRFIESDNHASFKEIATKMLDELGAR
ncbi:MAG: HEAT repeat domain-containing protein [Promethearchaeota archaeon]